jgi:hypothetical protein
LLLFDSRGRALNWKNRRFGKSFAAETATALSEKERKRKT